MPESKGWFGQKMNEEYTEFLIDISNKLIVSDAIDKAIAFVVGLSTFPLNKAIDYLEKMKKEELIAVLAALSLSIEVSFDTKE